MPALADTTIRLLGQDPLAERIPTSEVLRVAEVLDGAGFQYLEVSGGGVFDSAVRRGIESPWERIRALNARVKTPLGMALRGRFLVGSRPVDSEFVRRFIASAAENGIEVFRLNDPLNDVSNLREAAEAIAAAGGEFEAGLVYSSGPTGEDEPLVEQAKKLPELGAARVLLHDPTGSLQPHRAHELVDRLHEASGLPVGVYCQGSGGNALAAALEAARAGADLIATAVYPVALTLHRVSGESLAEALAGLGLDSGVDVQTLWQASDLVDEYIGDEPVSPLAPRIAVRAAEYDLPAGLVAALEGHLRAQSAGDRLDEVLTEVVQVRGEVGSPPLAAPIGQILGSQALLNVLSASRYSTVVDEVRALFEGHWGTPPGPDRRGRAPRRRADGRSRFVGAAHAGARRAASAGRGARVERGGVAAARPLRRGGGAVAARDPRPLERRQHRVSVERARSERIREVVRIVQETGVGEVTIEEGRHARISVKRTQDRASRSPSARSRRRCASVAGGGAVERARAGRIADGRRLLPLAGAGQAVVRRGRRRRLGRTDALPARGDEAVQRAEG